MINEVGCSNFSVRELCIKLGVSHNAVYKHFSVKGDLLSTVAEIGFNQLTAVFSEIHAQTDWDDIEKFKRLAYAYVEFAVANPNIYKLMFGGELLASIVTTQLQTASERNYGYVIQAAESCLKTKKIKNGTPLSIANTAWAMCHGLALLILDKQLKQSDDLGGVPNLIDLQMSDSGTEIQKVIEFSVDRLFMGLTAK